MKKYIITIIILVTIILLSVGGYFIYANVKTNESNNVDMLKSKCTSEVEFLSSNIISMMNELNNISYSNFKIINDKIEIKDENQKNSIEDNKEINSSNIVNNDILTTNKNNFNWDSLKSKIENMYSIWPTVMMDLTILNVNKDDLIKYNNILDQITKDFENEDKKLSLIHLADLHNLLSIYIKEFCSDNEKISNFIVKTNILYSYANIEIENWNKLKEYIEKAKQEFSNIINNQINNVNDMDVVNKAYILINELEKNINNKDKNIFYINYSNLMQELENID